MLSAYIKDNETRLFLLKNLYWKEKGQLGLRINLQVLIEKIDEIGMELIGMLENGTPFTEMLENVMELKGIELNGDP